MKTAISLPDDIFERADRRAKDLGLSRSEFFARAADSYLDTLDAGSVTEQIDDVVARVGANDESSMAAVASAHRLLGSEDEW